MFSLINHSHIWPPVLYILYVHIRHCSVTPDGKASEPYDLRNLGIIQPWACWDQVAHGYWGIHHESVTVNIVRLLFIWVQGSIKCKHNSITAVFLSIFLPNASKFIDTNLSWEYYNITELWFAFIHHPFISFCLHLIICLYHESMIIIIYLITSFFIFCFLSHFFSHLPFHL